MIIIIIIMAHMGSGLPLPPLSEVTKSGQLAALLFCDRQSHLSQENWVRNEFSLRNISIHARKVLLHAVNQLHGSLRRKWCCGFLSPLKIHRPLSGSNPRTLGPVASTLTTGPPRSTLMACISTKFIFKSLFYN
jgi:hypothetical protein